MTGRGWRREYVVFGSSVIAVAVASAVASAVAALGICCHKTLLRSNLLPNISSGFLDSLQGIRHPQVKLRAVLKVNLLVRADKRAEGLEGQSNRAILPNVIGQGGEDGVEGVGDEPGGLVRLVRKLGHVELAVRYGALEHRNAVPLRNPVRLGKLGRQNECKVTTLIERESPKVLKANPAAFEEGGRHYLGEGTPY